MGIKGEVLALGFDTRHSWVRRLGFRVSRGIRFETLNLNNKMCASTVQSPALIGEAMGICEIAVEFDESEMALIQAHANISNMSFSEFVRRAALEKVEDMVDIEAFNEALMEDDGTRYSMADAMYMAMQNE